MSFQVFKHLSFVLLFSLGWTELRAKEEGLPVLDGSVPLEKFCESVLEEQKNQKDTAKVSIARLLHGAEACLVHGNVLGGLVLSEAALKGPFPDLETEVRSHLITSRLLQERFENAKAEQHATKALALIRQSPKKVPAALLKSARIVSARNLRKDWRQDQLRADRWDAVLELETLTDIERVGALAQRGGAEATLDGDLKDEDDHNLIKEALQLSESLGELSTHRERLHLAELYYFTGTVTDRYDKKSKRLDVTPAEHYRRGIELLEEEAKGYPHDTETRFLLARIILNLENEEDDFTDKDGLQIEAIEVAVDILEELCTHDPANRRWAYELSRAYGILQEETGEAGDDEGALEWMTKGIEVREQVLNPETGGDRLQERVYGLAIHYKVKAYVLSELDQDEECIVYYRKALETGRMAVELNRKQMKVADWFSDTTGTLVSRVRSSNPDEAKELRKAEIEVLTACAEKLPFESTNHTLHHNLADALEELGKALEKDEIPNRQNITQIHRSRLQQRELALKHSRSCSTCQSDRLEAFHDLAVSLALKTEDPENPTELIEAAEVIDEGIKTGQKMVEDNHYRDTANEALPTLRKLRRQFRRVLEGQAP